MKLYDNILFPTCASKRKIEQHKKALKKTRLKGREKK